MKVTPGQDHREAPSTWHRLSDVNPVDKMAVCSRCGLTPIVKNNNSWSCEWKIRIYNFRMKYGIELTIEHVAKYNPLDVRFCAICLSKDNLHLDHDHHSKIIRGWLCRQCNTALGGFFDNPFLLKRAYEYLLLDNLDDVKKVVKGLQERLA